jgi:uncharacterized protein (DUF305 family)
MNQKILVAMIICVNACFFQSCDNSDDNSEKHGMENNMHHDSMKSDNMKLEHNMMDGMHSMHEKMKSMKMTGDFDHDFAHMMIMHHQGAIDMSEIEIAKGTDATIKAMAQNMITAQKAEIVQLQQFIDNYKMPELKMKNEEMHDQLGETMKSMMDKMNNMKMTGNTDKDFVMMMIPHHESAVTMAEDELKHGKQQELKKMAQKMITDQKKEISELKAWNAKQNKN